MIPLCIRIEKHLQCEKLLGLAGGNTKKRGNKKFGESITPIRYNVIHMYIFARRFSLIYFASRFPRYLVVFQGFGQSYIGTLVVGYIMFNSLYMYMHFRGQ